MHLLRRKEVKGSASVMLGVPDFAVKPRNHEYPVKEWLSLSMKTR